MKLSSIIRAALLATAAFASLASEGALAQTVVAQPNFAAPRTVVDLGNGPTEIIPLSGNGILFTAFASGTGTAPTTTALTLTASAAANPPCVGCFVTCPSPVNCSIPANTTVAAFNGTTGVTLSVAATVTAAVVNFGTLCPVSTQASPVLTSFGDPGVHNYDAFQLDASFNIGDVVEMYATAGSFSVKDENGVGINTGGLGTAMRKIMTGTPGVSTWGHVG